MSASSASASLVSGSNNNTSNNNHNNSTSNGLVRASEFCRRQQQQRSTSSSSSSSSSTILRCRCAVIADNTADRMAASAPTTTTAAVPMAYARSVHVLKAAGVTAGTLVWLSVAAAAAAAAAQQQQQEGSNHHRRHRRRSVLVRLELWNCKKQELLSSKGGNERMTCQHGQQDDDDENENENDASLRLPVLYISSLTAINLGLPLCFSNCCDDESSMTIIKGDKSNTLQQQEIFLDILAVLNGASDARSSSTMVVAADEVTLSVVGRPIVAFVGSLAAPLPLPPCCGTLLRPAVLIQVKEGKPPPQENTRKGEPLRATKIDDFFYEVVTVSGVPPEHYSSSSSSNDNYSNRRRRRKEEGVVYRTTVDTRYRFITGGGSGFVPQLPPLWLLFPHDSSSSIRKNNMPPHPDVPRLVRQWQYNYRYCSNNSNNNHHSKNISAAVSNSRTHCGSMAAMTTTTTTTPAECIWHVIGTDTEHHVVQAVQTAAAWTGRRCLVVAGLAATAHLCHTTNNNNNNNDSDKDQRQQQQQQQHTVTTGGLVDKLAGLQAALDLAVRHAPSLLLLPDLCQELSRHDAAVRHQEEARIWSVITETLSQLQQQQQPSSNNYGSSSSIYSSRLQLQVPAVLVVFATRKPLAPGPLLQNLVFASIQASLPDDDYVEHLWHSNNSGDSARSHVNTGALNDGGGGDDEQVSNETSSKILIPIATIQHLMKGRPAGEILELRDELMYEVARSLAAAAAVDTGDASAAEASQHQQQQLLEHLCLKRDEARRRKSGLGRIPAVKWDDVGGLANVRREIIDAIELPLKYPHMFSTQNGRRSGILLYGPPGTGKTLVAKAVATECGLPFVSVKGPELLGSYVGESEAQVRATFQQARELARQNQPAACVLFFDELDSLAPRRGDQASSGGNVMDRVVATLFAELDKDSGDDGSFVFCMGATNRPDLLDPALLRPGRFDRLVYLGVSASDRGNILATQIRKLRLEGDANEMAYELVQHLPLNLTGADLSTIASGGLLRATERLCEVADRELLLQRRRQQQLLAFDDHDDHHAASSASAIITVDDVLASWEDDQLEPIVTLEDLLFASRRVVPSVSAAELEHYDRLGQTYHRMDE